MTDKLHPTLPRDDTSRRGFLGQVGQAVVAGTAAGHLAEGTADAAVEPVAGRVGLRTLGKTGLRVCASGVGGHSWSER